MALLRRHGSSPGIFLPLLLAAIVLMCLLMLRNPSDTTVASNMVGHLKVQETEVQQGQHRRAELEITLSSSSLFRAGAARSSSSGAGAGGGSPLAVGSGNAQPATAASSLKRWEALTDLRLPLNPSTVAVPQGHHRQEKADGSGPGVAAAAARSAADVPGGGGNRGGSGAAGDIADPVAATATTGSSGAAGALRASSSSKAAGAAQVDEGGKEGEEAGPSGGEESTIPAVGNKLGSNDSSTSSTSSDPAPAEAAAASGEAQRTVDQPPSAVKEAESEAGSSSGGGSSSNSAAAATEEEDSSQQQQAGESNGGSAGAGGKGAGGEGLIASFSGQPGCPPLTKELLQKHSKDNTVMLGVVNTAQQDFALNWLKLVQRAGISNAVLGAVDANSSAMLAKMGVPCFDFVEEAVGKLGLKPTQSFDWGAEGWRRMTWHKVFVLDKVADWGLNIVMSDMDVAWLRDPLPLFAKHPHADLLFSTDGCGTSNEEGDDGLEKIGSMYHNFNTGVYLFRNTSSSARWAHAWRAVFESGTTMHDQTGAYEFTRVGDVVYHEEDPRVTSAWNKGIFMGIVPAHVFMNGHTYMVQKLHEKMKTQPFAVHLTWTYNGIGGKRARLRDSMLFFDEPGYYSEPSYVTVDLSVDKMPPGFNSWESEPMISFHLTSIQAQLYQAYIGMALATAAGRAFIAPKFQCFCEKIWYAVVLCRLIDAQGLQFPITCPTDYLFQPDNFKDDPAKYGTPLEFREPSFLSNPSTPPSVKTSVLVIQPTPTLSCQSKSDSPCTEEEIRSDGKTLLRIPANLDDKRLLPLLRPYTKYRVWQLSFGGVAAPGEAFAGFSCLGAAQRFDARMDHITTNWCCRSEVEAQRLNKTDQISVQLRMSPARQRLSDRPGLESGC